MKFNSGDLFGGLTAGIVALPLALAFGVQSGLGAVAGLYGAIFVGFFAALFGGTPTQVSGPTGPMTVVTTALVAGLVGTHGTPTEVIGAIVLSFVLAGLLLIVMGLCRLGGLIRFIPYPVISGFMSGIGVIIILLQLFPAVGLDAPKTTVDVIRQGASLFTGANVQAVVLTLGTVAIIYGFPYITKALPSTLVALIVMTLVSAFTGMQTPVIGDIPTGLPQFLGASMFRIESAQWSLILNAGITLAALGAIDSLLTSVVADNITKTRHDSNRELIGQGIGNAVSGLFGGIPGAGATMRTLVNIRAGGATRLSGMIHTVTLFAVLIAAGPYAAIIPNAVLSGILITVGIGILDYKGFRHIRHVPKSDAAIMMLVLVLTVFVDLLTAVGVGLLIASLLFMERMSTVAEQQLNVRSLDEAMREAAWDDEHMPEWMQDNVLVKHLDGPLFFGFANRYQQLASQIPNTKYLIIRMKRVPYMDQSGLYALEDAIKGMTERNIGVLLTGVQQQPLDLMRSIYLIPNLVPEEQVFSTFKEAVSWLSRFQDLKTD